MKFPDKFEMIQLEQAAARGKEAAEENRETPGTFFRENDLLNREGPSDVILVSDVGAIRKRMEYATRMLTDAIEINAKKRGGVPVVRGTRMPVSRLLAELADDISVSEFADEYKLNRKKLKKILEGLSVYIDRSFVR